MKTNTFSICPSCSHQETCVLTDQKNKVWSCSEYDTDNKETTTANPLQNSTQTKRQPGMAMA